jgi:hypothetical protein
MNQRPDDEEETESERRTTNIILLVAAVLVVGGGIWLVNALVDARKSQLCFESGRRNCTPIKVPAKTGD